MPVRCRLPVPDAVAVARLYHSGTRTPTAIAKVLRLSPSRVVRLLFETGCWTAPAAKPAAPPAAERPVVEPPPPPPPQTFVREAPVTRTDAARQLLEQGVNRGEVAAMTQLAFDYVCKLSSQVRQAANRRITVCPVCGYRQGPEGHPGCAR